VSKIPPLSRSGVARVRDLSRSKETRDVEGQFLVEGVKPIAELLEAKSPLLGMIIVTPRFMEGMPAEIANAVSSLAIRTYVCRETEFARLSSVETYQGILGVVRKPRWDESGILAQDSLLGIFGDRLQDPANVGAIVRIAAAFNVAALWLTPDSADVFNPKVVRAAAGALFRLPVFVAKDATKLIARSCELLCAEARPGHTVPLAGILARPKRAVLAFGSESSGLSEQVRGQAALRFHIPISRAVESLNVAASVAIAVYHFSGLPREI
jgi:TrmH family RNA methyltransferase